VVRKRGRIEVVVMKVILAYVGLFIIGGKYGGNVLIPGQTRIVARARG